MPWDLSFREEIQFQHSEANSSASVIGPSRPRRRSGFGNVAFLSGNKNAPGMPGLWQSLVFMLVPKWKVNLERYSQPDRASTHSLALERVNASMTSTFTSCCFSGSA
jgi:hypothetical protein